MAHGAPVVTSRGTSTEEVAGGAAVLVDPLDVAAIAEGIDEAVARRDELAAGRPAAGRPVHVGRHGRAGVLAAYRELVP